MERNGPQTPGKPDIIWNLDESVTVETLGEDGKLYTTQIEGEVLLRRVKEAGGVPGPITVGDLVLQIDSEAHS